MRTAPAVPSLVALVVLSAACSSGSSAGQQGPAATPAPTATSAPPAALTSDACRVLTAADVQTALGVPVTQLPLTSPPPGGGPDGALESGCTYASATASSGGVSLYLYRDLAIDYFANVPGVQAVPGVGDAAYEHGPLLIGRKGHVTFQLTIDSAADPAKTDAALRTLAHAVASRL
jgi:hypothetical protein